LCWKQSARSRLSGSSTYLIEVVSAVEVAIALRANVVVLNVRHVGVLIQEVRSTAVVTAIADVSTVTFHTVLQQVAPALAVLAAELSGTLPVTRGVSNVLTVCLIRPERSATSVAPPVLVSGKYSA
jgi:hypothetical protein